MRAEPALRPSLTPDTHYLQHAASVASVLAASVLAAASQDYTCKGQQTCMLLSSTSPSPRPKQCGRCPAPNCPEQDLLPLPPAVQAAVNLLGSVLDTPEFFWSAPDQLQVRV